MRQPHRLLAAASLLCALPLTVAAQSVHVRLQSYHEVPSVSSPASGRFLAFINPRTETIAYQLRYRDTTGEVLQAHMHLGQRHVNGGVSVFLCQTAASPDPTGLAPTCAPHGPATISGTLTAANVIGPAGQGVTAGEFEELVAAIRAGVVYVNLHTTAFPAGEIRGQTRGRPLPFGHPFEH